MGKKIEKSVQKEYLAYSLAVYLANKCYHRDHKGEEAAHRRYDGTIKQDTLCAVLLSESTIVQESLSLIGFSKYVPQSLRRPFSTRKPSALSQSSGAPSGSNNIFRGIFLLDVFSNIFRHSSRRE